MLLKVNRNDWTLFSKHYVCNRFINNIMVYQSLLFGSLINNSSFVKTLEKWDVKLISLRYNKWHWVFWIYIQKRAYNFFFKTFQNIELINLSKFKKLVHPKNPPLNKRPRGMARKGSKTKRTKLVLDMNHFILKFKKLPLCQMPNLPKCKHSHQSPTKYNLIVITMLLFNITRKGKQEA